MPTLRKRARQSRRAAVGVAPTTRETAAPAGTGGSSSASGEADGAGVIAPIATDLAGAMVVDAPARETRAAATNRWAREGRRGEVADRRYSLIRAFREGGYSRDQAASKAWDIVRAEYPPPGVEPAAPLSLDIVAEPATAEPDGVTGLGAIPSGWPELPANAPLRAEVEWVSANRLVVAQGQTVDLSKALTPAPSHAALAWLETAILFPAKFADISLRAAGHDSTEEREVTRRERVALETVRALLAEMVRPENEPDPPP